MKFTGDAQILEPNGPCGNLNALGLSRDHLLPLLDNDMYKMILQSIPCAFSKSIDVTVDFLNYESCIAINE